MDQDNNVLAAVIAGKEIVSACQKVQDIGGIPCTLNPQGQVHVHTAILDAQDKRAGQPRRLLGTAQLGNEQGFIDHVNRFKDQDSVIFSTRTDLTAVYDYHMPVTDNPITVPDRDKCARWSEHRARFAPEISDEWKAWIEGAGKPLGQEAFAEFIDEHVRDIAEPTPDRNAPTAADLATMALNLKIMADKTLESSINPTTGECMMVAKEEHKTVSSTRIPVEFDICIPIHTGGPKTRIVCKMRFRKSNGAPAFAWVVPGAAALLRQAMEEMVMRVRDATQLPVLNGKPEA